MDSHIIIIVLVIVAVGGSLAALGWWKLAAKAAPYQDEQGRPARQPGDEEVRVITTKRRDHKP